MTHAIWRSVLVVTLAACIGALTTASGNEEEADSLARDALDSPSTRHPMPDVEPGHTTRDTGEATGISVPDRVDRHEHLTIDTDGRARSLTDDHDPVFVPIPDRVDQDTGAQIEAIGQLLQQQAPVDALEADESDLELAPETVFDVGDPSDAAIIVCRLNSSETAGEEGAALTCEHFPGMINDGVPPQPIACDMEVQILRSHVKIGLCKANCGLCVLGLRVRQQLEQQMEIACDRYCMTNPTCIGPELLCRLDTVANHQEFPTCYNAKSCRTTTPKTPFMCHSIELTGRCDCQCA